MPPGSGGREMLGAPIFRPLPRPRPSFAFRLGGGGLFFAGVAACDATSPFGTAAAETTLVEMISPSTGCPSVTTIS